MTFSGRLRLSLILVALIPPLAATLAIYLYSASRAEQEQIARSRRALDAARVSIALRTEAFQRDMRDLAASQTVSRASQSLRRGRNPIPLELPPGEIHSLEIVDSSSRVLASAMRPGLVGTRLPSPVSLNHRAAFWTAARDRDGRHGSLEMRLPIGGGMRLVGGWYLEAEYLNSLSQLSGAHLEVGFTDSSRYMAGMIPGQLYDDGETLRAALVGDSTAGFVLVASFDRSNRPFGAGSLVPVAVTVSLVAVVGALAIGLYLTSRTRREIDNLIEASRQVAAGDLSTPVMAYEEGEFSELADALTDMKSRLRRLQRELATAETIAAWQAMGRKVAHEVKNPLTPISVSIDDLRRSYQEGLPDFEATLMETTGTVKAEINRMTKLLDAFTSFARLAPPSLKSVSLQTVSDSLSSLYRRAVEDGRVTVRCTSTDVAVTIDPEQIQQVLVNLVNNALETADNTKVAVDMTLTEAELRITVEDDGPGYPGELLEGSLVPRVSSKDRGFGLGLVICQRIVHDHGGSMELSNSESGASIDILIPRTHG